MNQNLEFRILESINKAINENLEIRRKVEFRVLEKEILKSLIILNSGFSKAKILKSDKLSNSGFWKAKILQFKKILKSAKI